MLLFFSRCIKFDGIIVLFAYLGNVVELIFVMKECLGVISVGIIFEEILFFWYGWFFICFVEIFFIFGDFGYFFEFFFFVGIRFVVFVWFKEWNFCFFSFFKIEYVFLCFVNLW